MTERKLGRKREHRNRTLRNLATSLVLYEKITTTEAKAKAVLPVVERLMKKTEDGSLAARRTAKSLLFDANAIAKLFEDIPGRRGNRTSGFVRVTKLSPRPGDGASMAQMELLLTPLEEVIQSQSKTKVAVRRKKTAEAENSSEETDKQTE